MIHLGLFILRVVVGGFLFGHGAQKLFGWFGGYGVQGTAGWLESMGMRPGRQWATLAGASEAGSGLLTGLGFLNPLGPIMAFGPMFMALTKVHWGKPVWVTEGGGELPITNMAVASALALTGPGAISLDRLMGIKVPWYLSVATCIATAAGIAIGTISQPEPAPQAQETAGEELQGGVGAAATGMDTQEHR